MVYLVFLLVVAVTILDCDGQECEEIGTLLECGYNASMYGSPNYTANSALIYSVPSATFYLPQLSTVIEFGCSSQTVHFGCATLFPSCSSGLGPCRSLCHKITTDCGTDFLENLQGAFVVLGPLLKCNKYPDENCVEPLAEPSPSHTVHSATQASPPSANTVSPTSTPGPSANSSAINDTNGCPPSSNNYYTDSAKSFAVGWIATWSVFSFLSTLLTMFTFLLKPSRFQYPWRPIVYLALCFNLHAIGYMFGLILGRTVVTCPRNEFVTTSIAWKWDHVPCLLVFGLLYYSMMAAFLWWLVLTIAWCLASVYKWSNEAIGNLAPFFHVVSWVLPVLMVIGLVAGRVVSAEELTGMCFVVRDDSTASLYALLLGVIIPLMVFLITGTIFLSIGLISVCRIHAFLRHKGQEKESIVLEKLVIRIGIFVSIYILPASVVIGCFFYELVQRPKWKTINEIDGGCTESCNKANPTIPIVRVFMFSIIGILTGVWIWSKKTLNSWKDLLSSIHSCCSPPSVESADPTGSSLTNMKY